MFKTEIKDKINNIELKSLINEYQYGRYCEDIDLPSESSRKIFENQITDFVSLNETQCIKIYDSNKIIGVLLFKLSVWDTNHFGYPIAIIDTIIVKETDYYKRIKITDQLLEELNHWLQINNISFVSVRLPSMDLAIIHSFEHYGFEFIESWVYNKFDLKKIKFETTPPILRFANADDKEIMVKFSKGAFSTQRFHADCRFSPDKADSLYEKWILSAFEDSNQQIAVLDIENKPAAYMIYYKKDLHKYCGLRFTMWKFAVIDQSLRGIGLGAGFFNALKLHHQKEGMDVIDSGVSLRNLPSINLHNKSGFKFISTIVTLHKWLK